jgi:hypothetical protein
MFNETKNELKAVHYSVSLYPQHIAVIDLVSRELAEHDGRPPAFSRALQHIINTYAEEHIVVDAILAADG